MTFSMKKLTEKWSGWKYTLDLGKKLYCLIIDVM